jgi:hypothetical protein
MDGYVELHFSPFLLVINNDKKASSFASLLLFVFPSSVTLRRPLNPNLMFASIQESTEMLHLLPSPLGLFVFSLVIDTLRE